MLLVCSPAAGAGPEITLDLGAAKFVWAANGLWKSCLDQGTGQERLAKPTPLATVKRGDQTLPASRLEREGNRLRVWFGAEPKPLTFELAIEPNLVVLRLAGGELEGVSQLVLGECMLKLDGTVADQIGGVYSDKWGLFVQALDYNGSAWPQKSKDGIHLGATYGRQFGFKNAGCVIMAAGRADLPAAFERMERVCGMPSPKLAGRWAKASPDVRRSYLFITDLAESNVEQVIAHARRGHFGYIQILGGDWAATNGTFAINSRNFPHGLAGLKATIAKLKAAGFKVGLHLLCAGIDPNDPLITPVPDDGLYVDTTVSLAADVDAKADFIPVSTAPDKFPAKDDGYTGHGMTLRIDDEIIRYGSLRLGQTPGFVGCTRGAYGTKPAPHKRLAPVKHLYMSYGLFLIDANSPLMDRVATNAAATWNVCDCDGIYFDGAEGLQGDHNYYNARIMMAYYSKLNKKDIIAQGSSFSQYTWHLVGRTASADGFRDIKGYLDKRSPSFISWYEANFMPLDIGWYAINENIRPDDIEYICGRAIGFNASVSIETSVRELDAHPQSGAILDMIARYEEFRLSGTCSEALRAELRTPRHEFRMVVDGGKTSFVPVKYGDWQAVADLAEAKGVVEAKNDRKTQARLEVDIKVGDTVGPGRGYFAPEAIMLADFEAGPNRGRGAATRPSRPIYDSKAYGGLETNKGCTMSIAPVADDVKEGKTACKFEAISSRDDNAGWAVFTRPINPPLDLTGAKGFGLWLHGDGNGELFKLQPRDPKGWHDYYVPVNWKGWRYIEMTQSMNGELDFSKIVSISFYYNGMPARKTCTVLIDGVKALKELSASHGVRVKVGDQIVTVRADLAKGAELALRSNGEWWLYPAGRGDARIVARMPALQPVTDSAKIEVLGPEDEPLANAITVRANLLWPQEARP